MFEMLDNLVKENPLLATVYSGGLVAIIVSNFRNIIQFIKEKTLYIISFTILKVSRVGYSYEEGKNDLEVFLANQKHLFQKSFELTDNNDLKEGFGMSWYIIFGKLVAVTKEVQVEHGSLILRIHMRVFFANKDKFTERLYNTLRKTSEIYENKISISFGWNSKKRGKRPLESIYTNDNIANNIYDDMVSFLNSKQLYIDNNILYKRNYLLYGKPGTGKSSLIFALASKLNFKIKAIDLKNIQNINDILYNITDTSQTIYVFEDIDAVASNLTPRDEQVVGQVVDEASVKGKALEMKDISPERKNGLDLSDILNILDGLYTAEGAICFFTTNHIEKLDKAFLRDGRMDYKVELDDLNKQTANKMIEDRLGKKNLFKGNKINPATLQEKIIQVLWKKMTIDDFKRQINS